MTASLIILAAGLFVLLIIQRIAAMRSALQLDKMLKMINSMKNGCLADMRLNLDRNDVLGRVAVALDEFADILQDEVIGSLERFAGGNFTQEIIPKNDNDDLRDALRKTTKELNAVLTQILLAIREMNSGALQVADASQSLSQGAAEQATSLEEISSSMIEFQSQTTVNAENASRANSLAQKAKDTAAMGSVQVAEMVMAMEEMSDAAKNISKINKIIDEIAFQTNLLALNAAVEAARAGKHGKGFAVVAEEVRALAARSAKASKETSAFIESSVEKTVSGTAIANKTAEGLGEIVREVSSVTELVDEIARSSNEQAQSIAQVNQGLNQIENVTQQNTSNAEQSAAAAEQLSGQVAHAMQMLNQFALKEFSPSSYGNDEGIKQAASDLFISNQPLKQPKH